TWPWLGRAWRRTSPCGGRWATRGTWPARTPGWGSRRPGLRAARWPSTRPSTSHCKRLPRLDRPAPDPVQDPAPRSGLRLGLRRGTRFPGRGRCRSLALPERGAGMFPLIVPTPVGRAAQRLGVLVGLGVLVTRGVLVAFGVLVAVGV